MCVMALGMFLLTPDAFAQLTDSAWVSEVNGVMEQIGHDKNAVIPGGLILLAIGLGVVAVIGFIKVFAKSR